MNLLTKSRIVITCFALFSMLFMQLAMASYTCPMMAMENAQLTASMPDCDGMDMEQPVLCHTHAAGEATKQSLDKSELPPVQPFVPSGMVVVVVPSLDAAEFSSIIPALSITLLRTTAPPAAILHCCFRI